MRNEDFIDKAFRHGDEREVVKRLNKGFSSHEIARDMNISEDWVKQIIWQQEIKSEDIHCD